MPSSPSKTEKQQPLNYDDYARQTQAYQDSIPQLRLLFNDQGFLTYIDHVVSYKQTHSKTGTHYAFLKQEQTQPLFMPALSTILYGAPNSITKKPVESFFM